MSPTLFQVYRRALGCALILIMFIATSLPGATSTIAAQSARIFTGTLHGAAYRIEVPAQWNGTLFLFSHGTVTPGDANPARVATNDAVDAWLRGHGYAVAGSSYRTTGWAVASALPDQVRLLDYFDRVVGTPRHVIAWGESLGGLVTAGLVQRYPKRLSGALTLCGPLAGTVAGANVLRDVITAFKALIAPDVSLDVVRFSNGFVDLIPAELALAAAQGSARGRARIALAAALGDVPGWYDENSPAPGSPDAQEQAQFQWLRYDVLPYAFIIGGDLVKKAGGNPSSNTGVDYARQLARSTESAEVHALYGKSGGLDKDLATLVRTRRLSADPRALTYAAHNIDLNGRIAVPVLTLHTIGDGLVPVEHEQAYAAAVAAAGRSALLRQRFVARAGHCTFTPAETVTGLQTIARRVNSGRWPGNISPKQLDHTAAGLPKALQTKKPAFVSFTPAPYLRPYVGPGSAAP